MLGFTDAVCEHVKLTDEMVQKKKALATRGIQLEDQNRLLVDFNNQGVITKDIATAHISETEKWIKDCETFNAEVCLSVSTCLRENLERKQKKKSPASE